MRSTVAVIHVGVKSIPREEAWGDYRGWAWQLESLEGRACWPSVDASYMARMKMPKNLSEGGPPYPPIVVFLSGRSPGSCIRNSDLSPATMPYSATTTSSGVYTFVLTQLQIVCSPLPINRTHHEYVMTLALTSFGPEPILSLSAGTFHRLHN